MTLGMPAENGQIPGAHRRSVKMEAGVLARMATTGIYLVSGVSRDVQRAARVRAAREGTTLRTVLVRALAEYAAGNWTPPDESRRSPR